MRLLHVLVILAAATVFATGEAAATGTAGFAPPRADKVGVHDERHLRSLKATDTVEGGTNPEEERFNLGFLKNLQKVIPGTQAKQAAVKAKQAGLLAEKAKHANLYGEMLYRDDIAFPMFKVWAKEGETRVSIEKLVEAAGRSKADAEKISGNFVRYRTILRGS
ncbi:hypothetical protein PHYPSEUDO_010815 [Phytophthora pseudosyringae]|uniref:RxLR effector protein n=1 Tax=Phytophthora pseudosyringae TaxID=221518 RepID=A0A8T1W702_9STRA|nr:hypothetical protein PHYPSEUDO_010815 [Phytophthora pseudosyringae]